MSKRATFVRCITGVTKGMMISVYSLVLEIANSISRLCLMSPQSSSSELDTSLRDTNLREVLMTKGREEVTEHFIAFYFTLCKSASTNYMCICWCLFICPQVYNLIQKIELITRHHINVPKFQQSQDTVHSTIVLNNFNRVLRKDSLKTCVGVLLEQDGIWLGRGTYTLGLVLNKHLFFLLSKKHLQLLLQLGDFPAQVQHKTIMDWLNVSHLPRPLPDNKTTTSYRTVVDPRLLERLSSTSPQLRHNMEAWPKF